MNHNPLQILMIAGEPAPLGATWTGAGVNFAVHCAGATHVELCVFDADGREVGRTQLPSTTDNIAHGFLPAPRGAPGMLYGYRAYGAYDPMQGLRFNPHKLLIDPYARALSGTLQWHDSLFGFVGDEGADRLNTEDSAPYAFKSRVVDPSFDWAGDHAPATPWRDTVIYELHVKGFTQLHPEVPAELRGKYLGLAHPAVIDHLKRLGITAVELLPVQAFVSERAHLERGLSNYWGYNTVALCAPAQEYAVTDAVLEFKTMVKALHAAGIEVILDVVFNHTAEGNQLGPTLSLKGLDNAGYYRLDPHHPRHYQDRSGCGNTLAIGHPATLQLVVDCLRYWVEEMRVDGFRFDLAPVLGRDEGRFRPDGNFFKAIAAESRLRYVKMIAEPWDVGPDGYQLSRFPTGWSEWNDLYRDTMRGFWRGNPGDLGRFAERFAGSSDLFRATGRRPTASINFVSCHDGFTLYDAVAFNDKHNEANGENNRDGHNHNLSWNCGIEGATDDAGVVDVRERQQRNFLSTLLLSQGVPMLQAGDEFGRTQGGNNNAYCQDNMLSWVNWRFTRDQTALIDFTCALLALRRRSPGLRRETFLKGARQADREHKDVSWRHPNGYELTAADWHDPDARAIGVLVGHVFTDAQGTANGHLFYICNASDAPIAFVLPRALRDVQWQLVLDTALWRPQDHAQRQVSGDRYELAPHSAALLADGYAPASLHVDR
ncbi:MAG TPA: glycogen debranching protein GlgX [Steroidobacteraceae bacterium]|nr:glycogen debranching protein GlgX [Steroidobacteraceae bacterium]